MAPMYYIHVHPYLKIKRNTGCFLAEFYCRNYIKNMQQIIHSSKYSHILGRSPCTHTKPGIALQGFSIQARMASYISTTVDTLRYMYNTKTWNHWTRHARNYRCCCLLYIVSPCPLVSFLLIKAAKICMVTQCVSNTV